MSGNKYIFIIIRFFFYKFNFLLYVTKQRIHRKTMDVSHERDTSMKKYYMKNTPCFFANEKKLFNNTDAKLYLCNKII